jgi:regulatory protein
MKTLPEASAPVELRRAAMDLLARREHSRRELVDKLMRRVPDRERVAAVIAQLAEEGLQCDRRFSESFVRSRAGRGFGPRRIRMELAQRGVERPLIEETLAMAEIDWTAILRDTAMRRFGTSAPRDAKERFKRLRWLQDRGFDTSGAAFDFATSSSGMSGFEDDRLGDA